MKVIETKLPGCVVIEPAVFGDARGYFFETWNAERFAALGLPDRFVQSNVSTSAQGVLRGLHYQWPRPQGKLVSVLEGEVYDVAVDIRRGSPTFGQWEAVVLSAENKKVLDSGGLRARLCRVVRARGVQLPVHRGLPEGL